MQKTLLMFVIPFLSGCADTHVPKWTQTYEGSALPDDQEVKLYHQFKFYSSVIVIDNVIYTKSVDDPKVEYKLAPGTHNIDYYLNNYSHGWAIGGFTIDMKAGHTYVLKHDSEPHMFKPWEATVILQDKTEDENVRIKHFPSLMSWDEDIQKLYEKYMEVGK